MTAERLEEITEKIDQAKTTKAKAEGQLENIEADWKEKGIKSLKEAEDEVARLSEEIESDEEKLNTIGEKIENAADWDEF